MIILLHSKHTIGDVLPWVTRAFFTEFGRKIIEDLTNVNVEEFGKITVGEQIQAVVRVLKEKQCFLVIDQFEAVINPETKKPEDQGFAEFLTCANEGLEPARVVVTGWEVPLDSRGMPFKAKILDGINASASRKLWEHHDLNINTNKMPKETKERLLEEIILRLHGHPFCNTSNRQKLFNYRNTRNVREHGI